MVKYIAMQNITCSIAEQIYYASGHFMKGENTVTAVTQFFNLQYI